MGVNLRFLGLRGGDRITTPTTGTIIACASTIAQLKDLLNDPTFSLNWEETTMDDGKPLVVSISERNADISGVICKTDKDMDIRFTAEQIHFSIFWPVLCLILWTFLILTMTLHAALLQNIQSASTKTASNWPQRSGLVDAQGIAA